MHAREEIASLIKRLRELDGEVAKPDAARDGARFKELMRERSRLSQIEECWLSITGAEREIFELKEMLNQHPGDQLGEMAREELVSLEGQLAERSNKIEELLSPKDPYADKDVIVEIRAGTGGEEAALFSANLYRAYSRYAEGRQWKSEVLDSSPTELGGFRSIVFSIAGNGAFEELCWESGVHRVQRVPVTEASGRIHTSAVTVAVLPEFEATEVEIRDEDVRVDVMRSSGPGGQSVNTTDSAVRLTHVPTGIVVHCQDEKSQLKNKDKAMRILRSRVFEREDARRQAERASARKSMIGTGDRSERIRTYNFPQNRVTDHRVNLTLHKLDQVMEGRFEELIAALKQWGREQSRAAEIAAPEKSR